MLDSLADGLDLFGRIVWDVQIELFFEFHNQFHSVQRVGSKVVYKGTLSGNLVLADAKLLGNDIDHTFFN